MVKKNSNKKTSAADDLLNSLIEDVDQFDVSSDDKLELEPTVYSPKKNEKDNSNASEVDIASNFLMPGFEVEKSVASMGLSQMSADAISGDDFWEQAEKMASKDINFSDLKESDRFKNFEKKESTPQYLGPEASSDFLDQINAHLSPVHRSGVVNTNSDPSNKSSYESKSSNDSYTAKHTSGYEKSKVTPADSKIVKGLVNATEVLKDIKYDKAPEFNDHTIPLSSVEGMEIPQMMGGSPADADRTVAVAQFANKQNKLKNQSEYQDSPKNNAFGGSESDSDERIMLVTQQKGHKVNSSQVSIDASLAQAENLRMAQNRILDLEKEIERLRQENDEILTASEILRSKAEEYTTKISELEKQAQENKTDYKNEIAIVKGNMSYKENENRKLSTKVEELELRIKTDFKKIRIRERELENRLELIKAEKQAIAKSKDELLLELQRKNDQAKSEIESYREKVQELNKSLDNNQSQIKMTVRALRIALSHIEDKSDSSSPIKKAN